MVVYSYVRRRRDITSLLFNPLPPIRKGNGKNIQSKGLTGNMMYQLPALLTLFSCPCIPQAFEDPSGRSHPPHTQTTPPPHTQNPRRCKHACICIHVIRGTTNRVWWNMPRARRRIHPATWSWDRQSDSGDGRVVVVACVGGKGAAWRGGGLLLK